VSYGLRSQSTDSRILRNQVTDSGFTESKWTCAEFPAGSFSGFFLEIADSTLTDSTDSRIPCGFRQKRSATPPRRSRPEPGPSPARGAFRLAWSRTTAWNRPQQSVAVGPFIGGQRTKIIGGAQTSTGAFAIAVQNRGAGNAAHVASSLTPPVFGVMALWTLYVHFSPPGCRSTAYAQPRLHQRVAMGTEVKKAVV
jgi:hypothetical protein